MTSTRTVTRRDADPLGGRGLALLVGFAALAILALTTACPQDPRASRNNGNGLSDLDDPGSNDGAAVNNDENENQPDPDNDDEDRNNPYRNNHNNGPRSLPRGEPHKAVWAFVNALQTRNRESLLACLTEDSLFSRPPTADLGLTDLTFDATWSAWRCLIGRYEAIDPLYREADWPDTQCAARLVPHEDDGVNAAVTFTLRNIGAEAGGEDDWRVAKYVLQWGRGVADVSMPDIEVLNERPITVYAWNTLNEYTVARNVDREPLIAACGRFADALIDGDTAAIGQLLLTLPDSRTFYPEIMHEDLVEEWLTDRRKRVREPANEWILYLEAERSEYRRARVERIFQVDQLAGPIAIVWLRFTVGEDRWAARMTFCKTQAGWRALALDARVFDWPLGD